MVKFAGEVKTCLQDYGLQGHSVLFPSATPTCISKFHLGIAAPALHIAYVAGMITKHNFSAVLWGLQILVDRLQALQLVAQSLPECGRGNNISRLKTALDPPSGHDAYQDATQLKQLQQPNLATIAKVSCSLAQQDKVLHLSLLFMLSSQVFLKPRYA